MILTEIENKPEKDSKKRLFVYISGIKKLRKNDGKGAAHV